MAMATPRCTSQRKWVTRRCACSWSRRRTWMRRTGRATRLAGWRCKLAKMTAPPRCSGMGRPTWTSRARRALRCAVPHVGDSPSGSERWPVRPLAAGGQDLPACGGCRGQAGHSAPPALLRGKGGYRRQGAWLRARRRSDSRGACTGSLHSRSMQWLPDAMDVEAAVGCMCCGGVLDVASP